MIGSAQIGFESLGSDNTNVSIEQYIHLIVLGSR